MRREPVGGRLRVAARRLSDRTAGKYGSNKIRITLTNAATQQATIAHFIFTP